MTIVFSTSSGWLSTIIKWFTKSRTSHSMIGIEIHGIPALIHATMGGVQITPRKKWFKDSILIAEYRILKDLEDGFKHAFSHLGDHYDYVGLLGYIPVMIGRWFGRKVKNPFASASAVVCSEFVLHLDHDHVIGTWKGLDPERTSPQDLLDICRADPANFEQQL